MTEAQRDVLAHLSDDQTRMGTDLTESGVTLRNLIDAGFIRNVRDCGPLVVCEFEITMAGHRALRASE